MVCEDELSNHYILQWARANIGIIESRANGTTFLEISKANFRPIPILVPPKSILNQFNSYAETIHEKIVNNLKQSYNITVIRDELLLRLITGKVRVS